MGALGVLWDWLTRFGGFWLLGAVVAACLAWLLMELMLDYVDGRVVGSSTVRLLVKPRQGLSFAMWLVLRRGIPLATGLLVFYLFLR